MEALLSPQFKALVFDMDNTTLFNFYVCMEEGCRATVDALGVGTSEELYSYYFRSRHNLRIILTFSFS